MPAGQKHFPRGRVVAVAIVEEYLRQIGQKSHVVFRRDEQDGATLAGQSAGVRARTDRFPDFTDLLGAQFGLKTFSDMRSGQRSSDHVAEPARNHVEGARFQSLVVNEGEP
jgi:hypothetical protein